MSLLDGKVAIITGASKGIGRALSLRFAREGAAVICAARSADLVKETAAQVKGAGGRAIAVVCDASQEDEVRRLVAAGVKEFGKVDTLVNNAGDGGVTKPVQDYSMDDWRYTIDSCLTSSYLCTRFVVPEMIKAGGGAIVNISSGAGRRGLPYRIGYCSAKAGQVGMTFGMALELAPHNIRVNCEIPGFINTPERFAKWEREMAKRQLSPEDAARERAQWSSNQGMRDTRWGTPEEIANLIVFAVSDAASYINGAELVADNAMDKS